METSSQGDTALTLQAHVQPGITALDGSSLSEWIESLTLFVANLLLVKEGGTPLSAFSR
jgi:hypothetical protein